MNIITFQPQYSKQVIDLILAIQKLLDTLISSLQSKNAHKAYLGTIDKYQAAIRFYTKNDFTQLSKEELPSYFPLVPVDNVFFYKDIS